MPGSLLILYLEFYYLVAPIYKQDLSVTPPMCVSVILLETHLAASPGRGAVVAAGK